MSDMLTICDIFSKTNSNLVSVPEWINEHNHIAISHI